jgi:hypothetical protein
MSKNDVVIKDLMAKVESQKKAMGSKPRVVWATNGLFKKSSTEFFNVNVVNDLSVLAAAMGFLIAQEEAFVKGCREIGIIDDTLEYKWDGYTVGEWRGDFKTRAKMIEWDKKNKVLEATKSKLSSLVSEEARTEMELLEIEKLLG